MAYRGTDQFTRPTGRFDKRSRAYERHMDTQSTSADSYNHPSQAGKRNRIKKENQVIQEQKSRDLSAKYK